MNKYNLPNILSLMERKDIAKEIFCTTKNLKAQVMFLAAGNVIPPCKMHNDVLFYFLSGKGSITIDNDTKSVVKGVCVIVSYEAASRSINAESDMEILAVQGMKTNTQSLI